MPIRRSQVENVITSPVVVNGLIYPANNVAGGDIRLVWTGANLFSRTAHAIAWEVTPADNTGFYAWWWFTSNGYANDTAFAADGYTVGRHPYPYDGRAPLGDGSADPAGQTGSAGTVHYYETAGMATADILATAGSSTIYLVQKNVTKRMGATAELINGGTDVRHRFCPDLTNPTAFIERTVTLASLGTPTTPCLYLGASAWTRSGTATLEAAAGTFRKLCLFNAVMTFADLDVETQSNANSAQTAAGQASVWYINKNPTPTDVADKSGQGHDPIWANANRPTLFVG